MSLKNVNKPEKNVAELEILIEKADFDAAVMNVYKRMVGKISIPGFRKGKAPKGIIEKHYGKGVFYEDALNDLLPDALAAAVSDSGVEVVSAPDIEVGDINEEGVSIKVKYFTKPVIELKQYKGLVAEKVIREVSEDEVNQDVDNARKRNARNIEVTDRPAQLEDTVTMDYSGSVDGEKFEGGTAQGHRLKLGSGQFIPGFEEQIVGHSVGDEFDVNVTFPAEYHAEDLKGKVAVFAVKLHKIEYEELPALDDEFAKDVSEFDTLVAYKADVKARIEERNNQAADAQVEDQLMDTLRANMEGDIPACMFENEIDSMARDYEQRMQAQGIDMKMYFKYTGMDEKSFREQFKEHAEKQVKNRLALEKVVQLEGIQVTAEEVEEEYGKIAAAYGLEAAAVKGQISEELLKKDVAIRKAVDWVKAEANITEKPYEALVAEEDAEKTGSPKKAKEEGTREDLEEEKPVKKAVPDKKKTETAAE
jgi:trigger factor